jgi:hypothetical protein
MLKTFDLNDFKKISFFIESTGENKPRSAQVCGQICGNIDDRLRIRP